MISVFAHSLGTAEGTALADRLTRRGSNAVLVQRIARMATKGLPVPALPGREGPGAAVQHQPTKPKRIHSLYCV